MKLACPFGYARAISWPIPLLPFSYLRHDSLTSRSSINSGNIRSLVSLRALSPPSGADTIEPTLACVLFITRTNPGRFNPAAEARASFNGLGNSCSAFAAESVPNGRRRAELYDNCTVHEPDSLIRASNELEALLATKMVCGTGPRARQVIQGRKQHVRINRCRF